MLTRAKVAAAGALLLCAGTINGQTNTDWGACRSYCSKTEHGNTMLEVMLTGRPAPAGLSPASSSSLEITTYADGFERNRFLVLPMRTGPVIMRREPGTFSTSRTPRPVREAPSPGLESLSVRSITSATTSPLSLRPSVASDDRDVVVTMDQADAGRTYFIRPAGVRGAPLVCQAAICPVDVIREPQKGGPR